MDNAIYEYIKHGITIEGNPIDGYKVFTIPTQHFHIDSLHQLTPQVFEEMIDEQKQRDELMSEMGMFKEIQKEFDQLYTIDRLYNNFINNPDYKAECVADLMGSQAGQLVKCSNRWEFVDKLLFDDDFYQKWGEDCCEEFTYEERYKLWFSNNYETGMEYNPEIEPDWDNDYYEPTPKRKLK